MERFDSASQERLDFGFAQHGPQRPADGAEVMVGVHVGGRLADEVEVTVELGLELGFDFVFADLPAQHPFQKCTQLQEPTVRTDERGDEPRIEYRGVVGEAGVPAEFERATLYSPFGDALFGVR